MGKYLWEGFITDNGDDVLSMIVMMMTNDEGDCDDYDDDWLMMTLMILMIMIMMIVSQGFYQPWTFSFHFDDHSDLHERGDGDKDCENWDRSPNSSPWRITI